MANPSSLEARIAAAHAESLQKARDLDREYETLSGNRTTSGIDLGKELEQHEEELRGLKGRAQLLQKALQDARAASEELREKRPELGRVLEANTSDTLQQLAKQVQRLFDEVPELGLLLGADADELAEGGRQQIIDDHKAAIKMIDGAEARLGQVERAVARSDAESHRESQADKKRELLVKCYETLMFEGVFEGAAPGDIHSVVDLIEDLEEIDPVAQGELLALQGLAKGTLNSVKSVATLLFKGVQHVGAGDMYDLQVADPPFILGFLLNALEKPTSDLGISESPVILRAAEILMLYLRPTKYHGIIQGRLEKLHSVLSSSKLVAPLYAWVLRRESPLLSLGKLDSVKVWTTGLLIDEGWLLMLDSSITVVSPDHYRFTISPRAVILDIDDYQGNPWSHEWTTSEVDQMRGTFEKIFSAAM